MKLVLAVATLTALVLSACSDDSGGHTADADGLARAARDAAEDLFAGRTQDSYRSLSAACRKQLSFGDWGGQLLIARGFFKGVYGVEISDLEVTDVQTRSVTASSGEVNVLTRIKDNPDLVIGQDDDWTLWLYEDGEWHSTDCETFGQDDGN